MIMPGIWRNQYGYSDPTAAVAIIRADRDLYLRKKKAERDKNSLKQGNAGKKGALLV